MVAETLPLKLLYAGTPFLTISESAREDIVALGVPEDDVHVGYLGVVPFPEPLAERDATPRLLYLGRLKRYKRIELLLDVLEGDPRRGARHRRRGRSPRRRWRRRSPRAGSATASSCTGTCPRS